MKKIALWLAWRYLRGSHAEKTISTMITVCFLGVFIGSCALALVSFVMIGFERTTQEKLQGVHSDILIRSFHQEPLNAERIEQVVKSEFPEVISLSPSAAEYALLQAAEEDAPYKLLVVRGIHPTKESLTSKLGSTIIAQNNQHPSLETLLQKNQVILGEQCAQSLQLSPGDSIDLLIPQEGSRKKSLQFSPQTAIIAGIFRTGIDEFDDHVLFCSLNFLEELFPSAGISSIGIKLHPASNQELVVQKLRTRLNLNVFSWTELYPALLSALMLEKYVMFFILALITLVASMSILSLLFMLVTQKRAHIALLRSMGLPHATIQSIFIWIGMTIGFFASISGIFSAIVTGYIIDRYQLITLPDVYYITHLPADIRVMPCLLVLGMVMALCLIASWLPTRAIRTMNISHILRFEG